MEQYVEQTDGSIIYNNKKYLLTKAFAHLAGRSVTWVQTHIRGGNIPFVRFDGHVYIEEGEASECKNLWKKLQQPADYEKDSIRARINESKIGKAHVGGDRKTKSMVTKGLVASEKMPDMEPHEAVKYFFSVDSELGALAKDYLIGKEPIARDRQLVGLLAADLQAQWPDDSAMKEFIEVFKGLPKTPSKSHHHNLLLGIRDLMSNVSEENGNGSSLINNLLKKYSGLKQTTNSKGKIEYKFDDGSSNL